MVQTQQHLAAAQSELESAKQAAEKANAERKELQTKLDDATSEVKSAQSVLAETKSVLEAAQSELERPRKRLRRRTPSAMKFRSNWTRPIGDQISPIPACGDAVHQVRLRSSSESELDELAKHAAANTIRQKRKSPRPSDYSVRRSSHSANAGKAARSPC